MALILADRVKETCAAPGTGTVSLLGASTGFQAFSSAIGDGNTCYYTISDQGGANWEVGIGTYASSGNTLARTTVLSSSAGGTTKANFSTGTQDVFVTYPAEVAAYSSNSPSTSGYVLTANGAGIAPSWQANANGDVVGPASATDNAVARFDGTTGKLIQNSAVTIGDDGATVIAANSSSAGLRITQIGTGNALVVEDSANPDSTPFVIDANGNFFKGYTSSISVEFPMGFQINGTAADSGISQTRWANNTGSPAFYLAKSRGSAVATRGIVQNGDPLGFVQFAGDDGANFVVGANIYAAVDGTPGTNDMPGRLVFSTTADGASSPTERMCIGSAGSVGIGGYAAQINLYNAKGITGSTFSYAFSASNTVQADVTNTAASYHTYLSTAPAAFTASNLHHFWANQGTIGSGSTVTNQRGFIAENSLTGATNNYGFYSNIAAGTGRWNFYAAGTAANYFAGSVGIGGSSSAVSLLITKNVTGASFSYGVLHGGTFQSDISNTGASFVSTPNTQATAFTLPNLRHFWATQGTIGAGSSVTNQYGFSANDNLTGATNNYGFYSNIASGTGRYNFYAAGSADNYFAGNTYIGQVTSTGSGLVRITGVSNNSSIDIISNTSDANSSSNIAFKQARGTFGAPTQTLANDYIGSIFAAGYTGSDFGSNVGAIRISAAENFTATNQGTYLTFWTANTGTTTRLERMRIDSAGGVGIGATSLTGYSLRNSRNITGGTLAFAQRNDGQIQSGVTSGAWYYRSDASTVAAAFTLTGINHYEASQGTFGAGSTVTNQFGFAAAASLTGATNNYGFYSGIASGTGRYNFFAAGSADNYFAGKVGIGATPGENLDVYANGRTFIQNTRYSTDALQPVFSFRKSRGSMGAATIVQNGDISGDIQFSAWDGSTFTGTASIQSAVDGTPGAGDMPGRLMFLTTPDGTNVPIERMRITKEGNVGIGVTPNTDVSLNIGKVITGSVSHYGVAGSGTVQSDVTAEANIFFANPKTQATSFTLARLNHFAAVQGTFGAGSTVTQQFGFNAGTQLTGATNNYGFVSNIASGTGRYNFYAAGSARNYFAGTTLFGDYIEAVTNATAGAGIRVTTPSGSASPAIIQFTNNPITAQWASIVSPAANVLAFKDGGDIEKFRLDSSGNLVVTGSGGLGYGTGSGGAVTQTTSRTTGVTLNKTNGAITLVSAAGSATVQSFTVTNSTVAATDTIIINQKSGTDLYEIHITAVAAGSFRVSFKTTGGTTTEQPVFNFAVIKAVTA